MAVDGGVVLIADAAVVGTGAAVACHHFVKKWEELERLHRMRAENAARSGNLLPGIPAVPQLRHGNVGSDGQFPTKHLMRAVWEAHGKDRVLRLGTAVVLIFSATQIQVIQLKPAAYLIHQQIAEQLPHAYVSCTNCKAAANELGKQRYLKNIAEDVRWFKKYCFY